MMPPSSSSQFPNLVFFSFAALPVLCVIVAGVVVAMIHWQHHPRPAMLTLLAMLFLGAAVVGQPLIQTMALPGRNLSNAQYYQTMLGVNVVFSVLRAAAFGLLLAAVFTGRSRDAVVTGPGSPVVPPPTRVL